MLTVAFLVRLQQQPMSVPLLMCYHNAVIQGRHVSKLSNYIHYVSVEGKPKLKSIGNESVPNIMINNTIS